MFDTYIERVREIKAAAAIRFADKKWEFKQGGRELKNPADYSECKPPLHPDDPLSWKLVVQEDGMNSYNLFDLRTDYTDEIIQQKFKAMEVAREALIEDLA